MYFKSVKNEYGFYEYMIEFFKLVDFDHITVLDLVLVDMKLMNLLLGSFVELILKDVDRFRLFCVSNVGNHNHGMVVDDDMDVWNDDVSTSDSMNYDTSSQGSFAPLTCIDDEIDFFYSIITTLKDLNHSLVTSSNSSSYRSLSDELIKLNSVDE
ncbi:hypothetical protein HDV02_000328 [Globomyces sp. JEL0801]|nr:hypothetical protein HDV02_000328 [Globomyces sp. JEL0801]